MDFETKQRIIIGIEEMISIANEIGQNVVIVPWYNNEIFKEFSTRYPNVLKSHRQFIRSRTGKLHSVDLMMISLTTEV